MVLTRNLAVLAYYVALLTLLVLGLLLHPITAILAVVIVAATALEGWLTHSLVSRSLPSRAESFGSAIEQAKASIQEGRA